MSFLKTFLWSLLVFMVSNLLLAIIIYASFGSFDTIIQIFTGNLTSLVYRLFCSMGHAIWLTIDLLAYHITNDNIFFIFLSLILLIAPLITAILARWFGEKRLHSFASLFLLSIISMTVSLILMFNNVSYQIIIGDVLIGSGALFNVVPGSLLNGIIYGIIAFFVTKK